MTFKTYPGPGGGGGGATLGQSRRFVRQNRGPGNIKDARLRRYMTSLLSGGEFLGCGLYGGQCFEFRSKDAASDTNRMVAVVNSSGNDVFVVGQYGLSMEAAIYRFARWVTSADSTDATDDVVVCTTNDFTLTLHTPDPGQQIFVISEGVTTTVTPMPGDEIDFVSGSHILTAGESIGLLAASGGGWTTTWRRYASGTTPPRKVISKAIDYTVEITDDLLLVTDTKTMTLPPATGSGRTFTIKQWASGKTVTIEGDGSDTIDGAANISLAVDYSKVTVVDVESGKWATV